MAHGQLEGRSLQVYAWSRRGGWVDARLVPMTIDMSALRSVL